MQAVLDSGATKYVKGAGTVVVMKLSAPAHKEVFEILRKATGGVVELDIEVVQETITFGGDSDQAPKIEALPDWPQAHPKRS